MSSAILTIFFEIFPAHINKINLHFQGGLKFPNFNMKNMFDWLENHCFELATLYCMTWQSLVARAAILAEILTLSCILEFNIFIFLSNFFYKDVLDCRSWTFMNTCTMVLGNKISHLGPIKMYIWLVTFCQNEENTANYFRVLCLIYLSVFDQTTFTLLPFVCW